MAQPPQRGSQASRSTRSRLLIAASVAAIVVVGALLIESVDGVGDSASERDAGAGPAPSTPEEVGIDEGDAREESGGDVLGEPEEEADSSLDATPPVVAESPVISADAELDGTSCRLSHYSFVVPDGWVTNTGANGFPACLLFAAEGEVPPELLNENADGTVAFTIPEGTPLDVAFALEVSWRLVGPGQAYPNTAEAAAGALEDLGSRYAFEVDRAAALTVLEGGELVGFDTRSVTDDVIELRSLVGALVPTPEQADRRVGQVVFLVEIAEGVVAVTGTQLSEGGVSAAAAAEAVAASISSE